MENPCKIVTFGDSITVGYTPIFKTKIIEEYREAKIKVINAGISGETSTQGLLRINLILEEVPDVVIVGFGMNDWRKGVSQDRFRSNITKIIDKLEEKNIRPVLMTINPDWQGFFKGTSSEIDLYNRIILSIAEEKKVRVAEVNALWQREIKPLRNGLSDAIHPNRKGYEIICKALMRVVPRKSTTILWGYEGADAPCNYRCPYCIDGWMGRKKGQFHGTISQWHNAFKKAFRNNHVIFYISYGEPILSSKLYEVMEMISVEPNWEMMMTTNLSQPLDGLVRTQLVKENRLNINASFHPTHAKVNEFLKKVLFLRNYGIEYPVIYVMYPPLIEDFEHYFHIFDKHNLLVHVRRFKGRFNNSLYPRDYTEQERRFIAKYADDATIKYMLNEPDLWRKLSYHGMYYITVSNKGDAGTEYFAGRRLGNILDGTLKLDVEPQPLLQHVEGSVTGIASILESGYHELEKNFVISFAKQGGVRVTDKGIYYPNLHTNFDDPRIRKEYGFFQQSGKKSLLLAKRPY